MGILLVQILQWILRIILFLLLLIIGVLIIVLAVPIRYQVEGEFLEKKPGGRGKVTWFFYLVYVSFVYEKEFRLQARFFGFDVFDSAKQTQKTKKPKKDKKKGVKAADAAEVDANAAEQTEAGKESIKEETLSRQEGVESEIITADENELAAWEKEMEAEAGEEKESANQKTYQDTINSEKKAEQREKKSLSEKIEDIKCKIQSILQKVKDIISKIQEGKLKAEHYLELWNRKETQITFGRAKTKLGRMIKAVLPRKWKLTGEIGLKDPCTTGQLMGALGALYPILGKQSSDCA